MVCRRLPLFGLALRLLLVAACVLPFSGVASAAPLRSIAPAGNSPTAPVGPQDEREEEQVSEERAAQKPHDRHPGPFATSSLLPVLRPVRPSPSGPSRPTAADPFRNGLGTPFRC